MQEGECWYLNFNLPHRVRNASPRDRIHLVVDCPVDAWLEGMFQSLGFGEEERRGPPSVQPELSRQEALQMIEHLGLIDTDTARDLMREIAGKHDLDRS